MAKLKSSDIRQVRCFNAELVAQAEQALPGGKLLEEAQVLFGALADRFRLKIPDTTVFYVMTLQP